MKSILEVIFEILKQHEPYLSGGAIRDLLLSKSIKDLDITVKRGALEIARRIAIQLNATFVPLDPETDTARVVVSKELVLDFSSFRDNATTIIEDLMARDFTINAMAIPLDDAMLLMGDQGKMDIFREICLGVKSDTELGISALDVSAVLIDPLNGLKDLKKGMIRAIDKKNLDADPLRCLRAYRFVSQLGFNLEEQTKEWIKETMHNLNKVAEERIQQEMSLILQSQTSNLTISKMADDGILFQIIPELRAGDGMEQPGFHHLDVLRHSLETLACLEILLQNPQSKLTPHEPLKTWIEGHSHLIEALKWAALLHDVAKPVCKAEKDGRTTFYQHDSHGTHLIREIGSRLRWPRHTINLASTLAALHMRPFHLLTDMERRKANPTKRAMRRLLNHLKGDYPALFLLAMADSMAGCGPLKPVDLDDRLSKLWAIVHNFYVTELYPIQSRDRLLTGRDIQGILGIPPGPIIGKALNDLEIAQLEGRIKDREQATRWLQEWYVSHTK